MTNAGEAAFSVWSYTELEHTCRSRWSHKFYLLKKPTTIHHIPNKKSATTTHCSERLWKSYGRVDSVIYSVPRKCCCCPETGDFLNFFGGGRQNRACALKTSEIKYKKTINIILRSNLKAPANTSTAILRLILVANDKRNPYLFISHSFISAVPSRTGTRAFIYPTAFLPGIYQSNHNNSKRWGTYFHF